MRQDDYAISSDAERAAGGAESAAVDAMPAIIELELVPLPKRPGYFSAARADGSCLLRAMRQPTFDGARALLAEGMAPDTVITTWHAGSSIVATRNTVGEAVKWTIIESDRGGLRRVLWRPMPNGLSSRPGVPKNGRDDIRPLDVRGNTQRPSLGVTGPGGTASTAPDVESSSRPLSSARARPPDGADAPETSPVMVTAGRA